MMRGGERGSVMVVVMVILVALLSAGSVAVYVQLADTRSTGMVRSSRDALYCAEAGLAQARPWIGNHFAFWNDMLDADPDNDPVGYPITGDLDGDGQNDFEVTIMDNDDEKPPDADPSRDNDLRVFVVAKCTKFPDTPREILELVLYDGSGTVYRNTSGKGSSNSGNKN